MKLFHYIADPVQDPSTLSSQHTLAIPDYGKSVMNHHLFSLNCMCTESVPLTFNVIVST